MDRISIDETPEQHQRLKTLAAQQGKSIEQFVLESTLGTHADTALAELETLLDQRHREAQGGASGNRTVTDIFQDARRKLSGGNLDG